MHLTTEKDYLLANYLKARMKGKMYAFILTMSIVASLPVFADPSPPDLPRPHRCELKPISPWKFRYAGCHDTTNYKTLNQYLALNLGPSHEFDQYRLYRGMENKVLPVSVAVVAAFLIDFTFTRFTSGLCVQSFNPSCPDQDRLTSFLPLPVYLTAIGVTVPLNVFVSRQRIRYLSLLIGQYNEGS